MSLMKKFYLDPYLHIRSFSFHFLVSACACAALYALHLHAYSEFHFAPWQLALIPAGIYVGGMSAVFIHNATHNSFRPFWLNRWAGRLAGLHQLWGFMGWKLIHLVHHQYSDNVDMDPHAPKNLTFWQFAKIMSYHSSNKITDRYREHWGAGLRTKLLHKALLVVFLGMAVCNVAFWYLLLGPEGFVFFYIPSYIANQLLFVDINYRAHPKNADGNTAPANLNHTWYFKLANFMWCGIYFHDNHHRRPLLFNPRKMAEKPVAEEKVRVAA